MTPRAFHAMQHWLEYARAAREAERRSPHYLCPACGRCFEAPAAKPPCPKCGARCREGINNYVPERPFLHGWPKE